MKIKKPGLRIIKTGLAVLISMLISELRGGLPFYSAIASVICLQQNVGETYNKGVSRVIGTIIGGLVGLFYLLLVPDTKIPPILNLILIGIISTLVIYIVVVMEKQASVAIAAIVFMSITINHADDPGGLPIPFAYDRVFDTLVGVLVAYFVNYSDFKFRKFYKSRKK